MNFFIKSKFFIIEQIFWIGLILLFFIFSKNIDILSIIFIPTIISYILFTLIKNKIYATKLKNIEKLKNDDDTNSNIKEKLENESSIESKKIFYKYFIFIYLFYIEFYFIGFPNIILSSIFFSFFILLIAYLKNKKNKDIHYYLFIFFIIIFLIPIIEKIAKI